MNKEEKALVQQTFNNTLFNANELNVIIERKVKSKKNKSVTFGDVSTVLY